MKPFHLFLLLFLISCSNRDKTTTHSSEQANINLTPLSAWLINNEDSLFEAFSEHIKQDTLSHKPEYELLYRQYEFTDGILGKLTDSIKQHGSCIVVIFIFSPKEKVPFEIRLSPQYDTNCIDKTDLIFSDISRLKHFKIKKYIQPDGEFSMFIHEEDTLDPNQIFFDLLESNNKFKLILYTKQKISLQTQELLLTDIFGEEVLLKKIYSITQKRLKDTMQGLKTIEKTRSFFGID